MPQDKTLTTSELTEKILNIVINAGTEKGTARLGVENVLVQALNEAYHVGFKKGEEYGKQPF